MHAKQFKAPGSSLAAPASRASPPLIQWQGRGAGKGEADKSLPGAKAGNAHTGTAEVLGLLQATDQPWAASLVFKGSLRQKSQLSVASAQSWWVPPNPGHSRPIPWR